MSKTAIIALLAELDDVDGVIFARMRSEMPAALRGAEIVPPAVVRSVLRHGDADVLFAIAGNLGLPTGRIAELYAGPALPALRALRRLASRNPYAYGEVTRDLAELMELHLAGSVPAWGRLIASLPTSAASLRDTITAAGGGDQALPLTVPPELRVDVRQLLLLAPPERVAELVPALRPDTVRDLVRFGALLPAAVLGDVVEAATPAQRLVLAKARRARPEVAGALVALGDPELDAAVYLNPRTGMAMRARIMASSTPLHASVVARVCGDWAASVRLPALLSGDPLLVRAALLKRDAMTTTLAECLSIWQDKGVEGLLPHTRAIFARADGPAPHPFRLPRRRSLLLITLLRLYERAGARAALDLVDESTMDAKYARHCRELLATPEGVDRLRAEIAARSGSRGLVRRLRAHPTTVGRSFLETITFDWAAIVKAHRRTPFTDRPLSLLAEQDGCPAVLRREAEAAQSMTGHSRHGRWPAPVTWKDTRPRRHRPAAERETARSVAANRTPIGDVLTGMPAALGAELLGRRDTLAPTAVTAAELPARLRQLMSSGDSDADEDRDRGVVALRLLQDFEGSLAELIATAHAATRH
ncbi:hypothetical protein [Streptomyces sp. SID3343]|uniref:hypothetical protein n=1 Tax=Streptomyces sp. SID3343 TaxID=2690260 RepID=UPI00136CF0E0|nr:hypothetical protein [Streptomyces sp. SID3343]MYV97130.1 hypothetical protein [Streptomyces sp. SID3343]